MTIRMMLPSIEMTFSWTVYFSRSQPFRYAAPRAKMKTVQSTKMRSDIYISWYRFLQRDPNRVVRRALRKHKDRDG
jgi:hypothetical protein